MRTWSLRLRILLPSISALLILTASLSFLAGQQRAASQSLKLISEGYLPLTKIVASIDHSRTRIDSDLRRLLDGAPRPGESIATSVYTKELSENIEKGRILARFAQQLARTPSEQAALTKVAVQLDRIDIASKQYTEVSGRVLLLADHGREEQAADILRLLNRSSQTMSEELVTLNQELEGRVSFLTRETESMQTKATLITVIAVALALALVVALVFSLIAALRPIGQLQEEVTRLAEGDYGGRVEVVGQDEIADLAQEFNKMVVALQLRDRHLMERAEEQKRSAARLARSERLALIGQMLARITHEVRNPLNALSLNAELLSDELTSLDAPPEHISWEILEIVTREIERLNNVTSHYLQLARREPATPMPRSIAAIVEESIKLLAAELEEAQVEVMQALEQMDPQLVDRDQLRQALINIIKNAVSAGAHRLEISLKRVDDTVELSVVDDGPGMSKEQLTQATNPFYTTKVDGTGLGLAITKEIIEDHEGKLLVSSDLENGTTITISLPYSESVSTTQEHT